MAGDLAALAPGILVDEAGYSRSGPNPLLAGIGTASAANPSRKNWSGAAKR